MNKSPATEKEGLFEPWALWVLLQGLGGSGLWSQGVLKGIKGFRVSGLGCRFVVVHVP